MAYLCFADPNRLHIQLRTEQLTLLDVQLLVGGYVELVRGVSHDGPPVVLIINEDGLPLGLDQNDHASEISRRRIVGDVVVLTPEEARASGWL